MKLNKTKLLLGMLSKELTLKMLAEVSGVSRATLSAAKNGKSCSFATVSKIAKALDVDVMELIETEAI